MSGDEYRQLRARALREPEPPAEVLAELQKVVSRLVLRRGLPPSLAPYNVWNEEAAEEVFQAWAATRLFGRGDLRALLARSPNLSVFRALCERSLRQFLLNHRDRTQSQNLYARVRSLLDEADSYRRFIAASRSQDEWWGLAKWDDRPAFNQDERMLNAAAWSLGDLAVIRYRADSRKLSPVLDTDELGRCVTGLFTTLDALLTPALILRALDHRLELEDPPAAPWDEVHERGEPESKTGDDLALRETAGFAISDLSRRQVEVLIGTADERTLSDLARELGCSPATVLNEQRRIGTLLSRLSSDDEERERLLNLVVDLLYQRR